MKQILAQQILFLQNDKPRNPKHLSKLPTMKRPIFFLVLLLSFYSNTIGQVCDFFEDYSDDTDWTFVYGYPGAGGCGDEPQTGTLQIAGGVMDFVDVCDANDTRMYRDLGFTVSDEAWTANFEFTPTAIGVDGVPRVGHVIFSLSAGNNCPFNDSWEHCIANDQDGIMVWYLSEYSPDDATTGFYIYAKDGPVYVNTAVGDNITAPPGATYYLTFKRVATNFVTLEVYLDEARTDLLDAINCFSIPDNITGLNVLQHGNAPWGYYKRVLSGTIDNTCIFNNTSTIAEITGATVTCNNDISFYEITGSGGATIEWLIPDEITFDEIGSNEIEIIDWGGLTNAIITATISSDCGLDTISFEVTISDLDTTYSYYEICQNDTLFLWGTEIINAGEYIYTTTNEFGCDSTNIATVVEFDTLFTEIELFICLGDSIFLNNEYVNSDGTYYESLVTANGCDSIITYTIEVYPENQINIIADTLITTLGGSTIYTETTETTETIIWTPITGLSCNNCQNPYIIPEESGWYIVTGIDENGCISFDSVFILVDPQSYIDIPNVFSPNGDGFNDEFGIVYSGSCEISFFYIYNRWGELIFYTNNINTSWNGNFNNIPQEIGTYVYLIEGNCGENKFNLTGTLTLLR